ncbi:MAG: DUF4258 domain-containing protein [Methanoregula sp.]|nr:DUF4258 domain-containing protein [Methanoregula sp.]
MSDKKYPAYRQLTFRIHALRQMFQRRISDSDIRELLGLGTMIEDYPDDVPYPSCLISGMVNSRPLHVVMAYNNVDREAIVITAYEPDPDSWSDNFTRRRL